MEFTSCEDLSEVGRRGALMNKHKQHNVSACIPEAYLFPGIRSKDSTTIYKSSSVNGAPEGNLTIFPYNMGWWIIQFT